jgi:hypothetical protein
MPVITDLIKLRGQRWKSECTSVLGQIDRESIGRICTRQHIMWFPHICRIKALGLSTIKHLPHIDRNLFRIAIVSKLGG